MTDMMTRVVIKKDKKKGPGETIPIMKLYEA